ncbi:hypothetical protein YC2023_095670 [Brassica napus]
MDHHHESYSTRDETLCFQRPSPQTVYVMYQVREVWNVSKAGPPRLTTTGSDLYRVSREPLEKQGMSTNHHHQPFMEHVLFNTMIRKESFKVMLGEIVPEHFMSYIQYWLSRPWRRNSVCRLETSTLGVVYAAAQLSRPVVPRLQRSINCLRTCVTEHIFGGVFGLLVGSECAPR